ncbi:hypothetical protein FRC19_007463 [Serendipita sp. 401]|nr:hypothetical protein FRC19_007463 [Serendipita sp. 401]
MMAVAQHIRSATGIYVPIEELWTKFRSCYEEDILEGFEKPGYHTGSVSSSSSDSEDKDEMDEGEGPEDEAEGRKKGNFKSKNSPKVGEDLERHPFFRKEFELPTSSGWPLLTAVTSAAATGGANKRELGHGRKESTVTATGRSTRAGGRSSAATKATVAPVEESDSDLTSDENGEDGDGDGDGDGDEEDRAESEGRGTTRAGTRSVVDADEQAGATRRSTRQTRTAPKETGSTAKSTTKKKRGK